VEWIPKNVGIAKSVVEQAQRIRKGWRVLGIPTGLTDGKGLLLAQNVRKQRFTPHLGVFAPKKVPI
jgi:hypothetical protein